MAVKYLWPKEIYFSQDSISNRFCDECDHAGIQIGKTLDALYEGRCQISEIPPIEVAYINRHWFTTCNRRLWIYQWLAFLGMKVRVPVRVLPVESIPEAIGRFTTGCLGNIVHLRGDHGSNYVHALELEQTEKFVQQRLTAISANKRSGIPPSNRRKAANRPQNKTPNRQR